MVIFFIPSVAFFFIPCGDFLYTNYMYTIFINYIYDEPIEWGEGNVNLPPLSNFTMVNGKF